MLSHDEVITSSHIARHKLLLLGTKSTYMEFRRSRVASVLSLPTAVVLALIVLHFDLPPSLPGDLGLRLPLEEREAWRVAGMVLVGAE